MILSLAIVECRRKVSELLQLQRIPPRPLPCCDSTASPHSSQADTTPGAVRASCRFPRLYSSETVSRQLPLSGPRLCWRVFYTMNREPALSRSVFQTSAKCHRPIPRSVSMEDLSTAISFFNEQATQLSAENAAARCSASPKTPEMDSAGLIAVPTTAHFFSQYCICYRR